MFPRNPLPRRRRGSSHARLGHPPLRHGRSGSTRNVNGLGGRGGPRPWCAGRRTRRRARLGGSGRTVTHAQPPPSGRHRTKSVHVPIGMSVKTLGWNTFRVSIRAERALMSGGATRPGAIPGRGTPQRPVAVPRCRLQHCPLPGPAAASPRQPAARPIAWPRPAAPKCRASRPTASSKIASCLQNANRA